MFSKALTEVTIELVAVAPNETELRLTHAGFPEEKMACDHRDGWSATFTRFPQPASE